MCWGKIDQSHLEPLSRQDLQLCMNLQVIVDLSNSAGLSDMRPTRAAVVSLTLQSFIREFFDQNPLSHLGLIAMRNGRADSLTDLSGSPVSLLLKHIPNSPFRSV